MKTIITAVILAVILAGNCHAIELSPGSNSVSVTVTTGPKGDQGPVGGYVLNGAVGNGIADDTAVISQALAAGLSVGLPDGVYSVTGDALALRSNQRLYAAGKNVTLKLRNPSDTTSHDILRVNSVNNSSVEGITFDCNQPYQHAAVGININGSSNITVAGNRFINSATANKASWSFGALVQGAHSNILFKGNYFSNHNYAWATETHAHGSNLIIDGNTFEHIRRIAIEINLHTMGNGVGLDGSLDAFKVTGNTISDVGDDTDPNPDYGGFGIALSGDGSTTSTSTAVATIRNGIIAHNTIVDTGNDGIHVEDGTAAVHIIGNTLTRTAKSVVVEAVSGATPSAIKLVYSFAGRALTDITVSGNKIFGEGITLRGIGSFGSLFKSDITISGNTIDRCLKYGVFGGVMTGYSIRGNTITNTQLGPGLYLTSSANGIVSGNRITDTQSVKTQTYGISYGVNEDFVLFTGNQLAGNLTSAFETRGTPNGSNFVGNATDDTYKLQISTPSDISGAVTKLELDGFLIQKKQSSMADANYNTTQYDHYIGAGTRTATRNIYLYTAAYQQGAEIIVHDESGQASTYPIVITPAGGDTIDGASTYSLNVNKGTVIIRADGSNTWRVVATAGYPTVITGSSFPVYSVTRESTTNGSSIVGSVKLERQMTGGTAVNGSGIGQYFKSPNGTGTSTHAGLVAGLLSNVTASSEVGAIGLYPAWHGADPASNTAAGVLVTATGTGTADTQFNGHIAVTVGGSANRVICWKSDGKTLGYCSAVVASDGTCGTCN